MNKSLDIIKSIEAFNRKDDKFKGIVWLIYGGFFLPKFNIHGLFHALMYIRGLSMKLGALSLILVFWEGQFWVLKINCNLSSSLGVMLVCTIPKCCSMLFIFVNLKVGWVYGQNYWHWFVEENKKIC